MKPYRDVVNGNNGIMSGRMMLLGWKLMNPISRFIGDYADIFTDILLNKETKNAKVKKFRTWYEYTQDIAGGWYLQACEYLFLKNLLVKGELKVKGHYIDLSKITCKVVMIAGDNDEITLKDQMFALGIHVSSKEQLEILIKKVGHIGCFMAKKSQKHIAEAIKWIHD